MLSDFVRASEYVPAGLDASRWESLEPLYRELIGRPVTSRGALERLILDRSELDAKVSETHSVLYISMTCHTDDAKHRDAYLGFIEHVLPRLKEAGFELDKKIVGGPDPGELGQGR